MKVKTTARLNVRKGIGKNKPIINVLEKGEEIEIIGFDKSKNWGKIAVGKYVMLQFVEEV